MIDLNNLYVGALVKIVDEWPDGAGHAHGMNKYLGQTLTVASVERDYFRVEEDKDGYGGHDWYWYPKMVEYIVEEDEADEGIDEEEFMTLLIG